MKGVPTKRSSQLLIQHHPCRPAAMFFAIHDGHGLTSWNCKHPQPHKPFCKLSWLWVSYHNYKIVTKTASIFPLCSLDRTKSKLPSLSPSGGKHKAKATRVSFLCWDLDSKVRKDSWNSYSLVLIALWWSQWNLLLPKKPPELTVSWTFFARVQGFPFNSGVTSNLQKAHFPRVWFRICLHCLWQKYSN